MMGKPTAGQVESETAGSLPRMASGVSHSPKQPSPGEPKPGDSPHAAASLAHEITALPILILYPHSRCNCRCVMCDIWKVTSVEEITAADLQRHLQDIRALGVEWVVLSGGEPLMHSDLFRLTSLLRDSGIRTTILTTGLLLAKNAARIAQCVDDVIVSLDGPPEVHDRVRRVPGAFARLADGVRALRSEQAAYPVAARCTVQRENHRELRRTVAAALDLGLDSISFLAADLTSAAFNRQAGWTAEEQARVALSSEEIDALDVEIGNLLRDHRAGIERGYIREQEVKLRRLAHHFRAGLGQETPVAPRCNAPWVSAVVESDGSVRPCFFHAAFGNLRSGGLHEVLNAPAAVEFRKNLDVSRNPICGRCVCSLYRA